MRPKTFYRRNLPHWTPPGAALFVTWNLQGSLPKSALDRLFATRQLLEREASKAKVPLKELKIVHHKKLFAMLDDFLDRADAGPMWLRESTIADMVQDSLLNRYGHLYRLWAYAVMPNHVHVLLRPKPLSASPDLLTPLSVITKRLKGYTAREANRILERTGLTFWQKESFDHWPRDENEFYRIVAYIENNPVKAGLVERPSDWFWSSAAERKRRGWTEIKPLT